MLIVLLLAVSLALAAGLVWRKLGHATPWIQATVPPTLEGGHSDPGQVATSLSATATSQPERSLVLATPAQERASPTHAMPTPTAPAFSEGSIVYGTSVNGYPLQAYRLGTGPSARALIGGIHGGYEWNTVELVSETLTHLQADHALIPPSVTLYLIPCANPDGAAAGTDAIHGRMNGNNVDLNRNWDYHHQVTATHGTRPVYAGDVPFSEPETRALRDFIFDRDIEAVIFYHSAMSKIFSGVAREKSATFELAEMMSKVTGYPHAPEGVPGQITTGNSVDYLSAQGISGIEIELATRNGIDWEQNWAGVLAFLEWSVPPSSGDEYIRHTIQPDETLLEIAIRYGVTVEEIVRGNDSISDPNQIQVGQQIVISRRRAD